MQKILTILITLTISGGTVFAATTNLNLNVKVLPEINVNVTNGQLVMGTQDSAKKISTAKPYEICIYSNQPSALATITFNGPANSYFELENELKTNTLKVRGIMYNEQVAGNAHSLWANDTIKKLITSQSSDCKGGTEAFKLFFYNNEEQAVPAGTYRLNVPITVELDDGL